MSSHLPPSPLVHSAIAAELGRLHAYLGVLFTAGARRALHMHGSELTIAHVLGACMRDEDCAGHAVVLHAFADPETIELELTALSPGILVVGSRAALPFSPRAVEALAQARNAARDAARDATGEAAGDAAGDAAGESGSDSGRDGTVETAAVLASAIAWLPTDLRELLAPGGSRSNGGDEQGGNGDADRGAADRGAADRGAADWGAGDAEPLFRRFSQNAKRALTLACKAAHARGERSIGPAQLVLACLEAQPGVGEDLSPPVSASRARSQLTGHTVDDTPPPERILPPHPELLALLSKLPQGGDSLDLLAGAGQHGIQELDALLDRHRLTPALLERARSAFRDPDPDLDGPGSS